jgi:uncharacterized protein YggE
MRAILVFTAFLALPLLADAPCDVHSITVSGTGTAKVVPDRVSFTVGVFTNSASVSEAFKGNNEKTHRVVEALKQRGVKDTEIQTSNFSITTAYDNYAAHKLTGYNVTNSVTVTREDPKSAGDLIAVAVEAGANEANGVTFFNSDPTPARDRAIERAVKDARVQAEKLAAATGSTLGRATMISTTLSGADMSNVSGWMRLHTVEEITVTSAPAIETGTSTISYSVTITYELR